MLTTVIDFGLVLLGFTFIIVVHELGHFVAAKWAGIRVLAFAVGFGRSIVSYRKGLGIRFGSSEAEFKRRVRAKEIPEVGGAISATEYRLNILPLGGYVKMLGQDDSDPSFVSDAPDSYQRCVPWKRMVVISAGVVMNIILAAILFCVVFTMGLQTESPRIGIIEPGSPAAVATPASTFVNGQQPGTGLKLGDRVLAVNGDRVASFTDISMNTIMARGGRELEMQVAREGFTDPIVYHVLPREDPDSKTLQIGVGPMFSAALPEGRTPEQSAEIDLALERMGFGALHAGAVLKAVNGKPVASSLAIEEALNTADGAPVEAIFGEEGKPDVPVRIEGLPALETARLETGSGALRDFEHLLGLVPPMSVGMIAKDSMAEKIGLQRGDIFTRLGSATWPSSLVGMEQISSNANQTIPISVLRRSSDGTSKVVDLGSVQIPETGKLGFNVRYSGEGPAVAGAWADGTLQQRSQTHGSFVLRERLAPGTRILSVNDVEVTSLRSFREALKRVAGAEGGAHAETKVVKLAVTLPVQDGGTEDRELVEFPLTPSDQAVVSKLGWTSVLPVSLFTPETVLLRETNPVNAIQRGLRETQRIMVQTYLTFVRLFQGTVKVEHLKGPVGIAHVGTLIASKGWAWLLFFLAIISVNLAVINFLPIPVTDGGHLLFLLYEQVTGKPPPVAFQNAAMLAGMVLIGAVFLFVLFNDIVNLTK